MNRRTTRRRGRQVQSGALLRWAAVAAGAAVIVIGIAAAAFLKNTSRRTDPETLCDINGPSAVTVILVDATDQISDLQRTAVLNRLERISRQMTANERLEIFELSSGQVHLKSTFSKCRPTTAEETDSLTGNKRLAAQRFDKEFKPAVAKTLEELMSKPVGGQSPIMEGVQAASVSALQATDLPDDAPRRLVVVSDMLQNGPAGSHYGGVPDFSAYSKTPQYAKARSDLAGVEVILLYLRRDNAAQVQNLNHVDFWSRWFTSQGAEDFRAVPIEG